MSYNNSILVCVLSLLIVATAVPAGAGEDTESSDSLTKNVWTGYISCGIGTPFLVWNICSMEGLDPNDDFLQEFTVQEDLKTLVVAMEWQQNVPLVSEELRIQLEEGANGGHTIASEQGTSPLEFRVDEGVAFDPLTGEWDLQFSVLPAFGTGLVYQQSFTVHYHEFYGTHAPAGYSALL